MCRVSIVVPVYNTENYISRCVDSVLGQTFQNFDLLLVDDGSLDRSGEICDAYAHLDNRIHVIHQINAGAAAARNTGIDWAQSNSDSQWITFVDSDDYLHPTMLEKLLGAAKSSHTKISICGHIETYGEPIDNGEASICVLTPEEHYFKSNINEKVVPWGKLYHKDCFEEIRFPEGILHEDEFVTYRLLFGQSLLAYVDAPLYGYFVNDAGAMRSAWKPKRMDLFDALDEQMAFFYQKGYIRIARDRAMYYAGSVWMNINQIRQMPTHLQYRNYIPQCRKKLRKLIRTYKGVLQLNVCEHLSIFMEACPWLALWYHGIRKLQIWFGGKG